MLDLEFEYSNEFFKQLLNNFEFLIVYFDNEVLFEDFNKLPGGNTNLNLIFVIFFLIDQEVIKKHDNLKKLMKR